MLENKIHPSKFEDLIGFINWFINRAASPLVEDAPKDSRKGGRGCSRQDMEVISRKKDLFRGRTPCSETEGLTIRWIPWADGESNTTLSYQC